MKLIPINICNAKVTGLTFSYDNEDECPDFDAQVALIDDYGKRITSISIGNRGWGAQGDCEASAKLYELAAKLKNELNDLITIYMNKQNKTLEAK